MPAPSSPCSCDSVIDPLLMRQVTLMWKLEEEVTSWHADHPQPTRLAALWPDPCQAIRHVGLLRSPASIYPLLGHPHLRESLLSPRISAAGGAAQTSASAADSTGSAVGVM